MHKLILIITEYIYGLLSFEECFYVGAPSYNGSNNLKRHRRLNGKRSNEREIFIYVAAFSLKVRVFNR